MKNILKLMDDLQNNAYKHSCYLKFFSGQQLFKINNYIKNKIENNEEKRSEIKHLLYHLMGDKINKLNTDYTYKQSNSLSQNNNIISIDIEKEEDIINTDKLNNSKNIIKDINNFDKLDENE